jgi:regulatory protein
MKTWDSLDIARHKIKNWCAYQERSHHNTRLKLMSLGLEPEESEVMIAELISENFLNEERFAVAFAGGKFRIKHWGRNKIKAELHKQRVSEQCIHKALASIDEDEYEAVMIRLIEKKSRGTTELDSRKQYITTLNYLVSRGFESNLVNRHLKESAENTNNEFGS